MLELVTEKNKCLFDYEVSKDKDLLRRAVILEDQIALLHIANKDYENASVNLISKGSCYADLGLKLKAIKAYEAAMLLNAKVIAWCKKEILLLNR